MLVGGGRGEGGGKDVGGIIGGEVVRGVGTMRHSGSRKVCGR